MRTALVTGGARRVGAALARGLAADGWHVVIHYNGSGDEAEALLAEIRSAGGSVGSVRCDLEDAGAVAALIPELAGEVPPFGLLVNNASLFEGDRLEDLTADRMDRHHAVNLRAPVLLSQAFARQVRAQAKDGIAPGTDCCIVNLLDNKVFAPNPDYLSYSLTKFGLEGLTRMLAMELAPEIRVAGIAPGVALPSGPQTEEEFERSQASLMLGRGCTPEQILAALRFILSAPAFTGQTVTIDGGQVLQALPRDIAFMDGEG
ncbi:SDR family oxidoreductase [Nisaea acidiphila]|uniref:SDR family oxidoreductase n=1 Tax=Nisaea acidiphila TaxID=1862145 RepID=A0A9J7AS12_9PROT|nr:SDR family oxidoreductase [Nisaea acidiphila]UUX49116.1 SDR family oxidoreductase [Nisaea acidiphila]